MVPRTAPIADILPVNRMKNYIYILLVGSVVLIISCNNLPINTSQVNSTLNNMECYKNLLSEIINEEQIKSKLIQIRNSKSYGNEDPVTVKKNFRTIDNQELTEILSENWKVDCLEKINKVNDLSGIRYIDESTVIIEIDKFKLHTLNGQLSSGGTMEIHRLIIADKSPNGKNYKFGTESIVWTKNLGANWNYEVSQYRTVH